MFPPCHRYVDRLRDSLRQTLTLADKMVFYEKEMVSRRYAAIEEEQELHPRVAFMVKRTKEMQKQMEKEISKKYKDRPVNIMGKN
ncbi:CDK5 regulatory subunit-associated protein 3-like [Dreissena polymorpha]|uniref:CDK5 regulatory subunit-associated protein 3-like n=1 Tax=Dreissena polymorpha TaxID=45954 RepID=UPI0022644B04|nr:CDK5 regulatory subunit-associated protein 3-like [Dreissena polymorpha]